MSLRFKLFLPLFAFCLMLGLYTYYSWLPALLHFFEEEDRTHLSRHMTSVADGLVPLLLEGQSANITATLDALSVSNPEWMSIELYQPDGTLIYPENKPLLSIAQNIEYYRLEHAIRYLDNVLGHLVVTVSMVEDLNTLNQLYRHYVLALILLLGIFAGGIAVVLEWVVRRPLKQLAYASDQIAQGHFQMPLSHNSRDEIGQLVKRFSAMRHSIQRSQQDLLKEINNHKQTAEQLYLEKERVSYHASHDALTGLINRREFEERLAVILEHAKKYGSQHALLYMDLDQFKVVNDTCGHIAGDELLRQLSILLNQSVRPGDTLARLGGDEYGVLLEHCNRDQAQASANQIREAVQDYWFAWESNTFSIGVSIGVVSITAQSDDITSLLSTADSACYAAKDNGRNRIHVYQVGDAELARRQGEMQWVSRVAKTLEENRFLLYSQPIVPMNQFMQSDRGHYEVLLRMRDEAGKIIPPGAFIPAAERYNLMKNVDQWVVKQVILKLANCHKAALVRGHYLFSINLSGASLSEESFLTFIKNLFKTYPGISEHICFEVTETTAVANLTKAQYFIRELKQLDCQFSLDDFGSGLSSFAYLKNLAVDYLKIDGLFIKDIARDPIDFAMVKSINEIGHVMGIKTIAEFVENEAIRTKLADINIDYVQGFDICQPYPLDEVLSSCLVAPKDTSMV